MVVIWSPASVRSGWVRDEAHEGLERGVLVPVLVGVAEPPIGYRSIHAVDLTGWEGGEHPGLTDVELAIDRCAPACRCRTGRSRSREPPAGPLGWAGRRWRSWRWRSALAAAALALLPSLVEWRDNRDRPPVPGRAATRRRRRFATARMPGDGAAAGRAASAWARPGSTASRSRTSGLGSRSRSTGPFAIGRTEVTFAQWQACVDGGGCGGRVPGQCRLAGAGGR